MPNRKEPRLEIEELQAASKPTSEPLAAEFDAASRPGVKPEPEPVKAEAGRTFSGSGFTHENSFSDEAVRTSSGGHSFKSWLAIFLALVALGLLAWQYLQSQQQQASIQLLTNRIQELEIRLSETGEDLSTAGSSFNEKLTESKAEITKLWSENDKLWKVAYRTNRPAISALESKNKALAENLSRLEKQLAGALAATESVVEQNKNLAAKLNENTDAINIHIKELNQRLIEVSLNTSTLDQRLRDQDPRDKLLALEKQIADLSTEVSQALPADLQARLTEQEEILASLEASRSQLVSRVTRLMEEVGELQQAK